MTAEWLVCANCAGRVSEGRCAVCRAELARLRAERGPWATLGGPAGLVALLLALVAVLALVARPA
ncbi:hypothetical protein [Streptomyces hainanensis]|uniref:Uncharacterized protein n=1 Tax=Streptomyces hainanensis TaxID=402648 RepID=A0A4R4T3C8_9ACTN|nr:hypothetical protein [Streptomyces hainanensis]TDC69452.1 hypothetical protein E1283_25935 [Streptomyces hainanensis]